MAAILQPKFSNALLSMKKYEYRLNFHCSFFLIVQMIIIWINFDPVHQRMYAALREDELINANNYEM